MSKFFFFSAGVILPCYESTQNVKRHEPPQKKETILKIFFFKIFFFQKFFFQKFFSKNFFSKNFFFSKIFFPKIFFFKIFFVGGGGVLFSATARVQLCVKINQARNTWKGGCFTQRWRQLISKNTRFETRVSLCVILLIVSPSSPLLWRRISSVWTRLEVASSRLLGTCSWEQVRVGRKS